MLLVYFTLLTFKFMSGIFYQWFPSIYVFLAPLVLFSMTFTTIIFYRIVFELTHEKASVKFSVGHYFLPLILTLVFWIISNHIPFDIKLGIIENMGVHHSSYPLFSYFFTSFMFFEILFSITYLILSTILLRQFRNTLNSKQKNKSRLEMRWLTTLITLMVIVPATFIVIYFISRKVFLSSMVMPVWALFIISIQLILLYNIFRHNYPPIESRIQLQPKKAACFFSHEINNTNDKQEPHPAIQDCLSRRDFDAYFRTKKPYLDPALKLTTLAEQLGTSRTALSNFINKIYHVNFNVYIGQWRLKELNHLQKKAENCNCPLKELLPKAGFGNYHSYMRAVQQNRRKTETKD